MHKGDIVLVPFPFTDLSGKKVRPALVLHASPKGADFVCAFISSVPREKSYEYDIPVKPSPENGVKTTSHIKLTKIATLQKTLAIGALGVLETSTVDLVDKGLKKLLAL